MLDQIFGVGLGLLVLAFIARFPLVSAGIAIWHWSRPPDTSGLGMWALIVGVMAEVARSLIRAELRRQKTETETVR